MAWLVRLKPHDRKKGNVLRRYTAFGMCFKEEQGWYGDVPDFVVDYLRTVHQIPGDESTPLAFDVAEDLTEAKGLMEVEKKAREQAARKADPDEPHPSKITVPANVAELNARASAERPKKGRGDLNKDDLPSTRSTRARRRSQQPPTP